MFLATMTMVSRGLFHTQQTLSKCLKLHRPFCSYKILFLSSTLPRPLHRYNLINISNCCKSNSRNFHPKGRDHSVQNRTVLYYCIGFVLFVGGATYASVLLYRLYCQATGKGGKAEYIDASERVAKMQPIKDRLISVHFNADLNSKMMWNFKPQQSTVKVHPGETALAFYTATNPTDKPITGIATYTVLPYEAGLYFNKIQCFCFEEQRLNPREEVDMPVFFYLDPEFAEDPKLETIDAVYLSYTFFEAKPGLQLPIPTFR